MTGRIGNTDHDELIERLKVRAADPDRRTDRQPSVFEAGIQSMSLGGMLSLGRALVGGLRRVVQSNQAGRMPDPGSVELAERLERDMRTAAPAPSLRSASGDDVRAAERALGLTLPPLLARAYTEVADGGFGPGTGLLSLQALVRETLELRRGDVLPRGRRWPPMLVPLVDRDPGWWCVDVATGAIIEWDPEDLGERSSEARFSRSFSEASPSVDSWLGKWATRKTPAERGKPSAEERWKRMAERAQRPEAVARRELKTRAFLAELSPEDRRKWGLDELYADLGADGPADDAEPR